MQYFASLLAAVFLLTNITASTTTNRDTCLDLDLNDAKFGLGRINEPPFNITDIELGTGPVLYVLSRNAREVYAFDIPGDSLLWVFGREGDGPGEFTAPLTLSRFREYITVNDPGHNRVTFISPNGTLAQVVSLPPTFSPLQDQHGLLRWAVLATLPDSTFVLRPTFSSTEAARGNVKQLPLSRYNPRTGRSHEIVRVSITNHYVLLRNGFGGQVATTNPLAISTLWVIDENSHSITVLQQFSEDRPSLLRRIDIAGATVDSLLIELPWIPTTDRIKEEAFSDVAEALAAPDVGFVPSRDIAMNMLIRAADIPPKHPPITNLSVASSGGVWAEFRTATDSREWRLLNVEEGQHRCIRVPDTFKVLLFDDWLWGVYQDSLGRESIYALRY